MRIYEDVHEDVVVVVDDHGVSRDDTSNFIPPREYHGTALAQVSVFDPCPVTQRRRGHVKLTPSVAPVESKSHFY